ncbi:hypothetical protein [Roseospira navarrensis]|uniref:Uncharacterized protein n=1 Tax=Roseospira navarrensis TaxID=140058 RepID=A0A7X1ZJ29_9PROT|nr:hypothetical protein [Roseospira navarrensis]MQX38342.1 hypothetical protein [Roseospira navarrensis]
MRVFLTVILPLLAPSLLYLAWLLMRPGPAPHTQGGAAPGDGQGGGRLARLMNEDVPWLTLVATGAGLTFVAVTAMYVLQPTGRTDMEYVPPRYEDGKIIPGEFVPREDADGQ